MRSLGLKGKLIISFLLSGLIPLLGISLYVYNDSSKTITLEAQSKLRAVNNVKKESINRYYDLIKNQITTFSSSTMVQDAMVSFDAGFDSFEDELSADRTLDFDKMTEKINEYYTEGFAAEYESQNGEAFDGTSLSSQLSNTEKLFQYTYIANNKYPLGSKDKLNFSNDDTTYSKFHKRYHPVIRDYLSKFGYYDIFLVNEAGVIVYSVYKELDYATNIKDGIYAKTGIGKAFRAGMGLTDANSFSLIDYDQYLPSYNGAASFISSPIYRNGRRAGILIFQMPIDTFNSITGERSGLGKTGETIVIGADYKLRSDSFLDTENRNVASSFRNPEKGSVKTEAVDLALSGKTGYIVANDYLGTESFIAYSPFSPVDGTNYAVISKIYTSEALAPVNNLRQVMIYVAGGTSFAILLWALFLAGSFSSTISRVAERLIRGADEVEKSSNEISSSSTQLSESATQSAASLQETVSSIDEISSMVQRNAESADKSKEGSSKNQEVTTRGKKSVEQMISSIKDIADSNDEITNIVRVISEIGEKTKVINDIVFQTKLLSFNASVEAARAGEHGKGFAVVAEEVGNLAAMSGKAALEITSMLDESINNVKDIVEKTKAKVVSGTKTAEECGAALDEIMSNATSINQMVQEIATASKEQSVGIKEVTKAMQQLDNATHQNTSVAQQSSSMANQLKSQAEHLTGATRELMDFIHGSSLGKHSHHHSGHSNGGHGGGNVVAFNAPTSNLDHSVKQAAGSDVVPASNDPRFEEL